MGAAALTEIHACPGVPYRCDRFDPADWEGEPPDFALFRQWEARNTRRESSDRRETAMAEFEFGQFEDPEEAAERAWLRVAARRGAALLLSVLAAFALVACDYVFAVIAFWYLPALAVAVVALTMGAELGGTAATVRASRRAEKAAHVTEGEKWRATVAWYQKPPQRAWWQTRPSRLAFWRGLALRTMYSSCFGLVVGRWAGSYDAGLAAGVAYTFWCMALGAALPRTQTAFGRVLAFTDPSAPRDTPEA
jgi:hypothetical protein